MSDHADILARLQTVVREALHQPELELRPDMVARDVEGWDSIAMVNVILETQKTFGIRFRGSEIDRLQRIDDFVSQIAAKGA